MVAPITPEIRDRVTALTQVMKRFLTEQGFDPACYTIELDETEVNFLVDINTGENLLRYLSKLERGLEYHNEPLNVTALRRLLNCSGSFRDTFGHTSSWCWRAPITTVHWVAAEIWVKGNKQAKTKAARRLRDQPSTPNWGTW